jgi:hypothetical protein
MFILLSTLALAISFTAKGDIDQQNRYSIVNVVNVSSSNYYTSSWQNIHDAAIDYFRLNYNVAACPVQNMWMVKFGWKNSTCVPINESALNSSKLPIDSRYALSGSGVSENYTFHDLNITGNTKLDAGSSIYDADGNQWNQTGVNTYQTNGNLTIHDVTANGYITAPNLNSGFIESYYQNQSFYDGAINAQSYSTVEATRNRTTAVPFIVSFEYKINYLQLDIFASNPYNSNCSAGIYADNGSIYPGTLIANTSRLTVSGIGVYGNAVPVTTLSPGLYWFAANCDQNVTYRTIVQQAIAPIMGHVNSTNAGHQTGYTLDQKNVGLLNTTFPAGATIGANYIGMAVQWRVYK